MYAVPLTNQIYSGLGVIGPPDLFAHAPEAREAISDICHQAAFEIALISPYIITNM